MIRQDLRGEKTAGRRANGTIYMLTSPSGKRYVGQTWDLRTRMKFYRNGGGANQTYLQKAIKKYGWENFHVAILSSGIKRQEILDNCEIQWISLMLSCLPSQGYNLKSGGKGGGKHSVQTKQLISEIAKARFARDPNRITICTIGGCSKPHKCRGYCSAHYKQWRTYGDPLANNSRKRGICIVEGCDKPHREHGFCSTHAMRLKRHGDPNKTLRPWRFRPKTCTVEGCERKHKGYGLCHTHLSRLKTHGSTFANVPITKCNSANFAPLRICEIPGCLEKHKGRGLCAAHLYRLKKHGNTDASTPIAGRRKAHMSNQMSLL
ncbi:MAG: GIY-YIG nuclease family protein [Gammaproteobacteria bacterium]|nr:GIY-YIG nuclease family protein [Gammaproteobacteria bacterium]MDD9871159.1 GIY-YIG nuclease family protein [Gammaproteobacteria bacterium]